MAILQKIFSRRVDLADGKLIFLAQGNSFDDSSPLLVNSSDQKYETIVEYTIDEGVTAGLCLFYNELANVRITVDTACFTVFIQKNAKIRQKNTNWESWFPQDTE